MSMAGENNDVSSRPEEGDAAAAPARRRKGKDVAGESSGGAIGRRATNDVAGVEVLATNGRTVKLNGPIEVAWSHGEPYPTANGPGFTCYYCRKSKKGGGVSRLREHLAGIPGSVVGCKYVPLHIKTLMSDEVTEGRVRRKRGKNILLYIEKEVAAKRVCHRTPIPLDEEGQIEMALRESLRDSNSTMQHENSSPVGKSISSGVASSSANHQSRIDRFYRGTSKGPFDIDLARSKAQVQPRVDVMIEGVANEQLGKAWAKWFHANDVAGRKADCPYFRSAFKLTQELGRGVAIPRGKEIDGPLLDTNYAEMEAHMAQFKDDWKDYGVTIMCDSWTGPTMMSIINFMICCNGRMFFHKSVNATGLIQNASYLLEIIHDVVVGEIGAKYVVQIVTDNGSNYKKACQDLIAIYPHITWQPCAAHTINLMLKDIGRFPDVDEVVVSAKRICRFLYNHNRLHAMMRKQIGGELVRWNATRFGTVFIFLQSFWDRKEKFQQWMTSNEWANCSWAGTPDHDYTYDCLTKKKWWSDMEVVLKAVSPIYSALRLADQEKNASISAFLPKMLSAMKEIRSKLSDNQLQKNLLERLMQKVNTRLNYLVNDTLMLAAAALDPKALYTSKIARNSKARHAVTLAIRKLARSSSKASAAIDQYTLYSKQGGLFGGEEAKKSALKGRCSAADWWDQYGGECSDLQEIARRIVSQCMSSSGCERNWSTFALVHTKLRNRLGYEKLHKLVFVHYNLKLRIQHFKADMQTFQDMQINHERDSDPCSIMIDVAMHDEGNPILDWLCTSRSESDPNLDDYDETMPDSPNPSRFVIEELGLGEEEVAIFKKKIVGKRGKKRKAAFEEEEEDVLSDFESESDQQGSPIYVESEHSISDGSENDGDGDASEHEGGGGSGARDGVGDDHPTFANPTSTRPKSKRLKKRNVRNLY